MEIQTWVSLVTIVAAMAGFYAATRREIRTEINGLRTELKGDVAELKADITNLDDRVGKLDDRVYALAVGLRPTIEARRHESG